VRRLLFLDFDGVLNGAVCWETKHAHTEMDKTEPDRHWALCPEMGEQLKRIADTVPSLEIVVSSTWRLGTPIEKLRALLAPFGIAGERVISATPRFGGQIRGLEIADWLVKNGAFESRIVILDDDRDMGVLWPHLIWTDFRKGLTPADADEAIKRLTAVLPVDGRPL